ncbi:MAG: hypothetical protein AAGI63_13105 [Planctomycetota bacterium]
MIVANQRAFIALLTVVLCMPSALKADDVVGDQTAIAKWIEQLDADSLTKRQKARTELIQSGKAAIPALTKAALSDKRDLIVHSIDILAEIRIKSEDADTKKAAGLALTVLSESNKPSTAQRAKLALEAKKDTGIQAFPDWDKPGAEFGGNRFGNAANRSVSVSNINGVKTITVKEAGKTTTLQDQPSGSIRVQITGGDQPQEFVVKNLDELKEKDPAAFALYKQHGSNAGGMGMNFPGLGRLGMIRNFGGNQAQANNLNMAGGNAANQMMIQQLSELSKRMNGMPEIKQLLDQQIKELKQNR